MKNILMIDIETTGQNPGCRVLTIGSFGFNKARIKELESEIKQIKGEK